MPQALPRPCLSVGRGGSQALGMAWRTCSLLRSLAGRCSVVVWQRRSLAGEQTHARCCEGWVESSSVPACAVVTSAVFVTP